MESKSYTEKAIAIDLPIYGSDHPRLREYYQFLQINSRGKESNATLELYKTKEFFMYTSPTCQRGELTSLNQNQDGLFRNMPKELLRGILSYLSGDTLITAMQVEQLWHSQILENAGFVNPLKYFIGFVGNIFECHQIAGNTMIARIISDIKPSDSKQNLVKLEDQFNSSLDQLTDIVVNLEDKDKNIVLNEFNEESNRIPFKIKSTFHLYLNVNKEKKSYYQIPSVEKSSIDIIGPTTVKMFEETKSCHFRAKMIVLNKHKHILTDKHITFNKCVAIDLASNNFVNSAIRFADRAGVTKIGAVPYVITHSLIMQCRYEEASAFIKKNDVYYFSCVHQLTDIIFQLVGAGQLLILRPILQNFQLYDSDKRTISQILVEVNLIKKALDVAQKISDKNIANQAFLSIAIGYGKQGNFDEAFKIASRTNEMVRPLVEKRLQGLQNNFQAGVI